MIGPANANGLSMHDLKLIYEALLMGIKSVIHIITPMNGTEDDILCAEKKMLVMLNQVQKANQKKVYRQ